MIKKNKNVLEKEAQKISSRGYLQTLTELKKQVQEAQIKSAFAANTELIKLYFNMEISTFML